MLYGQHQASYISFGLHIVFVGSVISAFFGAIPINLSFIVLIIWMALLEAYHWKFAKNDRHHRQFPHTFTFGFISLIIFIFISFSYIAVILAAVNFITHIVLDNHITDAFEKDVLFWRSIIKR
jgi:hypothetical protein